MKKLLIQFPTRARPQKFLYYLRRYIKYAEDLDNIVINVTCDNDDETMKEEFVEHALNNFKKLVELHVYFDDNNTKIEAVNRHIAETDFDIVLLASDDMLPQIKGYDNIIREKMQEHYPDGDGVLWFFDGTMPTLNTLSILGRKYFDRFGYIYHEDYISLWADNEFQKVAENLKKQTHFPDVIIKHLHPGHGLCDYDKLYQENESFFSKDEEIFNARKNAGFPIESVMKGKK